MQMNVVPLAHLFATIRNVINSTRYLLLSIAAIAFLVSGTALVNTMLMAVFERTREIGILRALGASRAQVFRLFLGETLLLCFFGAITGLALSFAASRAIETWIRHQLPYAPGSTLITPHLLSILFCAAFALAIGSLAALLPATRASRLAPTEAFRAQAAY
jgi:putative ABC transport system permease protein